MSEIGQNVRSPIFILYGLFLSFNSVKTRFLNDIAIALQSFRFYPFFNVSEPLIISINSFVIAA
jgi:hypothetical protein